MLISRYHITHKEFSFNWFCIQFPIFLSNVMHVMSVSDFPSLCSNSAQKMHYSSRNSCRQNLSKSTLITKGTRANIKALWRRCYTRPFFVSILRSVVTRLHCETSYNTTQHLINSFLLCRNHCDSTFCSDFGIAERNLSSSCSVT